MKFGKQIQTRQLELPNYAGSFVNYKGLKKLIKKLSATPLLLAQNEKENNSVNSSSQNLLHVNKVTFFFQLERELEKVNAVYLQKEAELQIRLKTLLEKKKVLKAKNQFTSRRFAKFATLEEGFQQFVNDLKKLQQLVEINRTALSKILKKWDKVSKSKTKELYLSRAVEVQLFFNPTVISELSDQATSSLQELGAWSEGDLFSLNRSCDHMLSSQHLLATDEDDADTLLLDTVISGNIDSLKDLLLKLKISDQSDCLRDSVVQERVTRTFLAATNRAQPRSLQLLLDTGLVDLHSEDDINERNCLHQATIYGNLFVLNEGLKGNVAVSRMDVYGRIPLHYASMYGRLDMVETLIDSDPSTIDFIDHDHSTPLIHAIRWGHFDCVEKLITCSARIDAIADAGHIPLNLACQYDSMAIVELLLKHGAKLLPNAEGLYPQHLVARSGQIPRLLLLLKEYGADLNQIDKLYSWTPLLHAASEGNVSCMRVLLDLGVQVNILDEKGLSAMYYAAWEGHLECMQLLSSTPSYDQKVQVVKKSSHTSIHPGSGNTKFINEDTNAIPDLELPPPIIPLRRYGHNFLDNKTLIQISFDEDEDEALKFFHDCKYPAARLFISSKSSDLIHKNILLPFQEDTKLVSFKIDNLDTFVIDFEVYPTYGARIIAKTVALPHTFITQTNRFGHCCLPLFDPRLRVIGQITFNFQVVRPFRGEPLEITDFETYWKATSHLNHKHNLLVTNSSLSGDYIQLFVQQTCDGVPVLWPKWTINHMEIDFPINRLTYAQFILAGSQQANKIEDTTILQKLLLESSGEFHRIRSNAAISLKDALELLPKKTHINLQILYPTVAEEQVSCLGRPTKSIDVLCDAILTVVFDHARKTRERHNDAVLSVIFSSFNSTVCTALNWKQPNYPIFLNYDLGRQRLIEEVMKANASFSEIRCRRSIISMKEAVKIAKENNFMGICCSSLLLEMLPTLIETIKVQGLILIMNKFVTADPGITYETSELNPNLPRGIDGVLKPNGVLSFN